MVPLRIQVLYLHCVDRLESGRFPSSVHFGGAKRTEVGEKGLGWGNVRVLATH